MPDPSFTPSLELLKNSILYGESLLEKEEILRHKWIESEKAGRDIGWERARTDWLMKHGPAWREHRHRILRKQEIKPG